MKINFYIFLLIIVLFASCEGAGTFYTVRSEEKIENSSFSDGAKIQSIFPVGSNLSDPDYIIAQGASIWYKTPTGSWTLAGLPDSLDDDFHYVQSAVEHNDGSASAIYASFKSGTSSQIHSYNLSTNTWTRRDSNLPSSTDDYFLFSDPLDPTHLYVNQRKHGEDSTDTSSQLYYFNSVDLDFNSSTALEYTTPVISMAYDSIDGTYWMVASNLNSFDNGTLQQTDGAMNSFSDPIDLGFGTSAYTAIDVIDVGAASSLILVGADFEDSAGSLYYRNPSDGQWNQEDLPGGRIAVSFCDMNPLNETSQSNIIFMGCRDVAGNNRYSSTSYQELNYDDGGLMMVDDELSINGNTIAESQNLESSDLSDSLIFTCYLELTDPSTVSEGYKLYAGSSTGFWSLDSTTTKWGLE